ncbi:MoaD/ThiS family protein [Moorellaceae bacterium AZ2]
MISVTLRIGGGLSGIMRVIPKQYTLPDNATLQDLIDDLCQHYGKDILAPSVLIAVNGRRVGAEERAQCFLKEGDVVSVVQAMAGG